VGLGASAGCRRQEPARDPYFALDARAVKCPVMLSAPPQRIPGTRVKIVSGMAYSEEVRETMTHEITTTRIEGSDDTMPVQLAAMLDECEGGFQVESATWDAWDVNAGKSSGFERFLTVKGVEQ